MSDVTIPGTDQSFASFVEFRDGGLSVVLIYRPDDTARHLRTLANEYRKLRPDSHSAHVALNLADVMLGAGPKEVAWYGSADAADWAADGSPQNVAPDVPCEGCAIGDCIRFGCQDDA